MINVAFGNTEKDIKVQSPRWAPTSITPIGKNPLAQTSSRNDQVMPIGLNDEPGVVSFGILPSIQTVARISFAVIISFCFIDVNILRIIYRKQLHQQATISPCMTFGA